MKINNKSIRIFAIFASVLMLTMVMVVAIGYLLPAAAERPATEKARNVIFFHPDGYGLSHWDVLRIYTVGPDNRLNWDKLPHWALYRTHMLDAVDASSHGGATAHAFGIRVPRDSFGTFGGEKLTALSGKNMSIMQEAIRAGFATGLVQTGCITEPGTAVFVASVRCRFAERESIARQIIESGVPVILGGGERYLLPKGVTGRHGIGRRTDGVNLIEKAKELNYTVVFTRDELMEAVANSTITRVLGVFACGHTFNDFSAARLRVEGLPLYWPWAPTVAEMSNATLKILSRTPEAQARGIFLVVEEEGTDNFPNVPNARGSFEAGRRADEALGVFRKFVHNNPNTLLITTADTSAGTKNIVGVDPVGNPWLRNLTVVDGRVYKIDTLHDLDDERTWMYLDGTDGVYTLPFLSAPDKNGRRFEFAVVWASRHDAAGGVVVRADGLNAGRIREMSIVHNTDIYRIMYYTLFGKWLS